MMRALGISVAIALASAGVANAQTPRLPFVRVEPVFVDGQHTACSVQFIVQMGLDQRLSSSGFASGSFGLWREGGNIAALLKIALIDGDRHTQPETAYLIDGFETNAEDAVPGREQSDDGRYALFGYEVGVDTLMVMEGLGSSDRGLTIGFTLDDGSLTRRFNAPLTSAQRLEWSECWAKVLDDWLKVDVAAAAAADAAAAAADAVAAASAPPEPVD